MELPDYLSTVASQLVNELTPILSIKGVTTNPDLLGKYTEASVRNLVTRIVGPMRVCTGAVLDYPIPIPLRQIDLIIWAPFPAPAIFEVEGFGLVPKSSAFGVIEVKRSNYSGVEDSIEAFLADAESRKIVANPVSTAEDLHPIAALAVISVLEAPLSSRLQKLAEEKKLVAIFEATSAGTVVRARDVLNLVNFLHFVTWRYRIHTSSGSYPQLNTSVLDTGSGVTRG